MSQRAAPEFWLCYIRMGRPDLCDCPQAREYPEAEKTLRMAAHLLIKAVLQYLPVLVPQPDFGECWQRILQVLQVSRNGGLYCLR